MKLLATIAVSALLVPATPGLASEAGSPSNTATALGNSLPATPQDHGGDSAPGPVALTADNLEAIAGMGAGTDFLCGAVSGAGLAIALSGIGAGLGLGLTAAGFVCSVFL